MAKYTTENIHAVALVGHGGAGKTLLAEALLWKAGVIGAMGSTERGTTVCDFDPLEKQYGHSLSSSLVNFPYKGIHVHLIDTPGMPDFAGQSIAALAGVETAVIVINAQNGIELNTTRMFRAAGKRGIWGAPRGSPVLTCTHRHPSTQCLKCRWWVKIIAM